VLTLKSGRSQLTLIAPSIVGDRAIDVYSVVLDQIDKKAATEFKD